MQRYAPFRFRPAFALAAVALSAATISLAVGVPAALSPSPAGAAEASAADPAGVEVTIVPARIEVVGLRDASIAATPERAAVHRSSIRS